MKLVSLKNFEVLSRTVLSHVNGGGAGLSQANCNTGAICTIDLPECGGSTFTCYCQFRDGIVGKCIGR